MRQKPGNDEQAEAALKQAAAVEPAKLDFLYALAYFYLIRGCWSEAERAAEVARIEAPQAHRTKPLGCIQDRRCFRISIFNFSNVNWKMKDAKIS